MIKVDRDEVFVELTRSICPVCKAVIDAQVNVRDDRVYLRKRCREHGEFEALVYGDARMYFDSVRFNRPGTIPLQLQTEVVDEPAEHGFREVPDTAAVAVWRTDLDGDLGSRLCRLRDRGVLDAAGFLLHEADE